tara:strand:- start:3107 stop:5782 length:2676 start_codon:yes stop_codon:yes gene_type:complete
MNCINDMSFLESYFEYVKNYPESIVLIQKGKFYECYQFEDLGKSFLLGNIINTTVVLCNNEKIPSWTNPYMAGFQIGFIDRNLPIILDSDHSVVVIDQDPNDVTVREIKAIYSPGTYTEKNIVSNNIVSIYVEQSKNDCYISLASIDLSTGTVLVFEIHNGDFLMKLEECYRISESQNPSEIIIVSNAVLSHEFKVIFENTQRKLRYIDYDKNLGKISYQNSVLTEVYNIRSQMSAIEYLNLERYSLACHALIVLLSYCIAHNKHAVYNLEIPILENFENKMILHNNSIYQLNIVNTNKDKSLFKVLDHTSTPMGKRLLHATLLNPIFDEISLQKAYNEVENMIPIYKEYENKLQFIVDVEKLHRKMGLSKLKPIEFWNLIMSYENLQWILEREDETLFGEFKSYYTEVQRIFYVEKLRDHKDFETNLFNVTVNKELDALFTKLSTIEEKLVSICDKLNTYISNGRVKLETDHIETTQTRSKKILDHTSNYNFVVENKQRALIKNSTIDTLFHEKIKTNSIIKPRVESLYHEVLQSLHVNHKEMYKKIHRVIAHTDLKKSKAKCAVLHNYTKPILNDTQCLQILGMKHPIITQLDNDITFDPYNVDFSNEKYGMLLYGVNGSGKSTYSKSIALNVVMAQSGHYVCAKSMLFKPFERLYTRLGDADNIYKGQSSFFVEMGELKSILHYADERSLIIGDEPCRGTEDNSALSIVSFTLEWLLKKNSTFVFATHLHMLTEISCIKNHSKLLIKHVSVDYNNEHILIYTHKIEDGKCKRNYGLEIAQRVLDLPDFDERTNEIFNEITKKPIRKRCKYNKNVHVQKCEICHAVDNLHTHHIVYQHTFHERSLEKNQKSNLVVLCEKHHLMTHQNKLIINGWIQSIEGPILDYKTVT